MNVQAPHGVECCIAFAARILSGCLLNVGFSLTAYKKWSQAESCHVELHSAMLHGPKVPCVTVSRGPGCGDCLWVGHRSTAEGVEVARAGTATSGAIFVSRDGLPVLLCCKWPRYLATPKSSA